MQYRKKPVVIEAFQWDGKLNLRGTGWPDWLKDAERAEVVQQTFEGYLTIRTLEGDHRAQPGDWIIRGVKGELYPCKPDIFAATYDAVSEGEDVGMYKLHSDQNHHRVVVGDFTITRMDDKTVWIESESRGDGGSFSDADFEAALKQFYEGNF